MREVSRPVRRKEIGDVQRCSNAPISYPTKGEEGKEQLQNRYYRHRLFPLEESIPLIQPPKKKEGTIPIPKKKRITVENGLCFPEEYSQGEKVLFLISRPVLLSPFVSPGHVKRPIQESHCIFEL